MDEPKHTLTEKAWLLAPLIFFLTFVVFIPALSSEFVNWDDDKNFTENAHYRGLGWTQIHWMWTTPHMGVYIPITWMTLGLDYLLWGMDAFGYRLTNVLWHCGSAVLLYFIVLQLFGKSRAGLLGSAFAALVFALHPLRAESVAWITERRDVVSGFFYLAAILFYLVNHKRTAPDAGPAQPPRRKYRLAGLACFVLAVFSKAMTVTLPAIMVLLDVYPLRRLGGGRGKWFGAEARKVWFEKLPFFAIAAIGSFLAFLAQPHEGLTSLQELGWLQRIVITIYGLAFYVWKTIVPVGLVPFYALTSHRQDPLSPTTLLSLAAVIVIVAAAILLRRRLPIFTAAAIAYAIMLLPVIGIFHNGQQITADRYSYLPCLAWAILAGGCAMAVWNRFEHTAIGKGAVAVVAAGLMLALGALTWRQAGYWRDSEALWNRALAIEPSFIAWNNMGMVLAGQGDRAGAIDDYHKSITLMYRHPYSHNNLGASLLVAGDWDAAISEFQIALEIKPDLATAHHGWGYALVAKGNVDEGIEHIRTALTLNPYYEAAQKSLDWALSKKGSPPPPPASEPRP